MSAAAKKAKANADRLFSIVVRARDGACVKCGSTQDLECAHTVPRRFSATRTDLANANALCHTHHAFFTEHPLEFRAFMEDRMGVVAYSDLWEKAVSSTSPVDWDAEVARLSALAKTVSR